MACSVLCRVPDLSWSFLSSCVMQVRSRLTVGILHVPYMHIEICKYCSLSSREIRNRTSSRVAKQAYMHLLCSSFATSAVPNEVSVLYQHGLPVITVPLPSRQEKCRFTLKPVTNTAGDLLADIQREDRGVDRVVIQTTDGVRIASSTSIASLMQENFHLTVNDKVYLVCPPDLGKLTSEELESLSDIRARVAQLYEALNVEEHQLELERRLVSKLEVLRDELEPLEKKKEEVLRLASRRSTFLSWFGLALMGAQFGILARLTWWEYSWDIMEPVTYFITYGTTIAMYAYFVLTRQEYVLPDVCDRQTLLNFHKRAAKCGLDVKRYNELRNHMAQLEEDLRRLRDPLQLHLPLKEPSPDAYKIYQSVPR